MNDFNSNTHAAHEIVQYIEVNQSLSLWLFYLLHHSTFLLFLFLLLFVFLLELLTRTIAGPVVLGCDQKLWIDDKFHNLLLTQVVLQVTE